MQTDYFSSRDIDESDRYIYNCYINSSVKPQNYDNRIYTEFDTYPTIISAIGGKIKGDRLGLGVNLYSKQKTLAEKYGMELLNEEIVRKSTFYNDKILGSDYELMLEENGIDDEENEED